MKVTGRVWVFGDDINTDLILPHKALRLSPEEQCRLCMSDNRPGWADQVMKGDFLIAGKNFGTGSSRPGAAVLKNLGLAGMIAESYNGLFYRNCICYGFAAVTAPGITEMFAEGDMAEIDYSKGTVRNLRTGKSKPTQPLARVMLDIISAGGIEGVLTAKGYIDTEEEK